MEIFYRLVLMYVFVLEYYGCYGNLGKFFGNKINVYYLMLMMKVILWILVLIFIDVLLWFFLFWL